MKLFIAAIIMALLAGTVPHVSSAADATVSRWGGDWSLYMYQLIGNEHSTCGVEPDACFVAGVAFNPRPGLRTRIRIKDVRVSLWQRRGAKRDHRVSSWVKTGTPRHPKYAWVFHSERQERHELETTFGPLCDLLTGQPYFARVFYAKVRIRTATQRLYLNNRRHSVVRRDEC